MFLKQCSTNDKVKKTTILLVDDERIITMALSQQLKVKGYEVLAASSGEEAIEIVQKNSGELDLIFMDIDMPGIDGTEAARRILQTYDIPLVFHTGHTDDPTIEKMRTVTSYGNIPKNSSPMMFDVYIKNALKLHEVYSSLKESEAKYRMLLDKANEGIFILQDFRFDLVNPSICAMLNVPREELGHKPFIDFVYPEDRAMIQERHTKRIAGEAVADNYDFRIMSSEGKVSWVSLSAAKVQWLGRPATINLLTDITERKRKDLAFQKLLEISREFLGMNAQNIDYQFIVDNVQQLFGAKYVAFNRYSIAGDSFVTKAMAGLSGLMKMVRGIGPLLGFEIIGEAWTHDEKRKKILGERIITRFPDLFSIAGIIIPQHTCTLLEKMFGVGEFIVVKTMLNEKMLGELTLIMPPGVIFDQEADLEMYAEQIGALITRVQTEEAFMASRDAQKVFLQDLKSHIVSALAQCTDEPSQQLFRDILRRLD